MAKTIMIIDDSILFRKMLSITLSSEGYDIVQAASAGEAMEKVSRRNIDLMICDYIMPVINGVGFLRMARQSDTLRSKPVIMLSSSSRDSVKEDISGLGVSMWKTKPYDPVDILSSIRDVMSQGPVSP